MARKKVKKRIKMSKFERLLYTLAQINFEVEKQKKLIEAQNKTNESLSMKINELASLDKIEEVAKSEGLSYNNNNIKNVEDEK